MSDALKIINADATDEEIAAIVLALGALSAPESPTPRRTSGWASPQRAIRRPHHSGADQWRTSNLPN